MIGLRIPINKIGNIEVEHNILKYRIPVTEVQNEDINVLEKNLKRKVQSIEHIPYYVAPFEIQLINNSVVYYYNMVNYKSFDYLRQLSFEEKLKYYLSLVEIAKQYQQTKVLWDRHNFVVDPFEEKIKAILYETEDIKIYDEKDPLEGAKSLILISLTNLNNIIGKPRRVDFIDHDEDIIQFAETLLSGKIETIEDLGFFIETKLIEYEHASPEEKEPENEVQRKELPSLKLKTKKRPKFKKEKTRKKSNKLIYIIFGALIIIGIALNMLSNQEEKPSPPKVKEEHVKTKDTRIKSYAPTKNETSNQYNNQLLQAYRLSLVGKQKEAIKSLEEIGYKNLGDEDKEILLNLYQKNNELYKVIDLEPNKAKEIVNDLIANGKDNQLPLIQSKMKTHNPYVDFEVAYMKQDWKTILKLKDKVEINGRKEHQITEAYLGLKEYDKAKKYAESIGDPDLIQMVEDATDYVKD